ncbi:MAG: tryptophan synthase subunit beta [Myxococcales bacterium]|nr:tryptophan synthase subunit beta [Myxococcales bacterium]
MHEPKPVGEATPGRYGAFGGQYVAETLMPALHQLTSAWSAAKADPAYWQLYDRYLRDTVGRPSLLTEAPRLSEALGARLLLKREDLNHTGSHKINNCIGQVLLAKRLGKTRIIAETGAGQHGVATATVCAMFDLPCEIYMGARDVERQQLNVLRMRMLGATVHAVAAGSATLKDALNEALRDWVTNVGHTHYIIGSVAGPHPYPEIVRDLQAVIGREALEQTRQLTGDLPDAAVACVGGGSNAAGLFAPMVPHGEIRLFGVEAAGDGLDTDRHAATISRGVIGVLHGAKSLVLCEREGAAIGQIIEPHSISAGLDYPGVGPEHAYWHATGRVTYLARTDAEALAGMSQLARLEGILCALESAHAVAALPDVIAAVGKGKPIVVNISGRGDKDMHTVAAHLAKESA